VLLGNQVFDPLGDAFVAHSKIVFPSSRLSNRTATNTKWR
jgi:hypothetical protein